MWPQHLKSILSSIDLLHHHLDASIMFGALYPSLQRGTWRKHSVFHYLMLNSSLIWQELCSEYRNYLRNGQLPCTRENDPIEGPDGKIHGNTCSMCEAFLWVELRPLFLLSAGEARPVVGEREHAEDFLSEADSEGDLFTEFGDLLLQSCLLSAFL